MARPLRLEFPGALWHITARGNEQQSIYRDDHDRLKFLEYLSRAVERSGWILHAYVLMSNHFHLVVETPECTLSRGMQWLNGCYAQYFNRVHKRVGHLFQGRFKGVLVCDEEYFLEVGRYAVLNPVRAGMVGTAGEYRWSSFRATAGLEARPDWLTIAPLLGRLRRDRGEAQALYREFVGEGLKVPSPWEKISGQMYLGGRDFLRFVQEKIDEVERSEEHPREMREVGCPSLGELADAVAETFETTADEVMTRRGGEARLALAHLGWHEGRLRLGQIAKGLGVRSRGHVSNLVKRSERRSGMDSEFRERLEECRRRFQRPPPESVIRPL